MVDFGDFLEATVERLRGTGGVPMAPSRQARFDSSMAKISGFGIRWPRYLGK